MSTINVTVTFVGVLGRLIHEGSFEVVLSEKAVYQDLTGAIWDRFGETMPEPLWDRETNTFREPIFALVNGRPVDLPGLSLKDGDDLKFLTLVAGG